MQNFVLNLVINGLPSIPKLFNETVGDLLESFKPCYKWITFNTQTINNIQNEMASFKPCYKWITFNTVK